MYLFYQPNGLLWGPAFHKNHTPNQTLTMFWGCGTCPPMVTAATNLGDGDFLEMMILI